MEWIKKEDGLPDESSCKEYLLARNYIGEIYLGWFNSTTGDFYLKDYDDMPVKARTITHWMKIPNIEEK